MQQLHIHIAGRVQGVFFRAHAKREADRVGITGWVCNTDNGGVEVVAQGEESKLAEFLDWCRRGPDSAEVVDVKATWGNVASKHEGYKDFQVRF